MNSHRGLNISRKLKWRHPSCHVRKCGGRDRPSFFRVVGTSQIRYDLSAAEINISLANSIPVVCRLRAWILSRLKARKPQFKPPPSIRHTNPPTNLITSSHNQPTLH